jgi:hypothetical protein
MQLFLPTLITVVIAAILAFLVIPRTGALILASVSLLALIAAGIHHYNLFYSEYMLSTWQNGLGANASFVILALAIIFIIGSIFYMFVGVAAGGTGAATGAVNTIQEALAAPFEAMSSSMEKTINAQPAGTSGITNMITTAIQNVKGAANTVTNAISNVAKVTNNVVNVGRRNNISPLLPGLDFRASQI